MTRVRHRIAHLVIVLVAVAFAAPAGADDPAPVGQVVQQSGAARLLRSGVEGPLRLGESVRRGDRVATGPGARLRIAFVDGAELALGENAQVDITAYAGAGASGLRAVLNVLYGIVRATVTPDQADRDFSIHTRAAVVSVRATDFLVEDTGDKTAVFVVDGRVAVTARSDARMFELAPGFGIDVPNAGDPVGPRQWPETRVSEALACTAAD